LICATNRKCDLDSALLSRFDLSIKFELPDVDTRYSVYSRYAKHLGKEELKLLALKSDGLSCRNIKDACKSAERKWAAKIISKEANIEDDIPLSVYLSILKHAC